MSSLLKASSILEPSIYTTISKNLYSTKRNIWANAQTAEFVASANSISTIPKSTGLPEIVVTGRANVGKSTLLNCILGRKSLVNTSKKAGHTKALNLFRVGAEPGKLILVDAPGYGTRGRVEWGELFKHYIQNRPELKRVYILFNAKHGLNETDKLMLAALSSSLLSERGAQAFTLQSIITKADTVPTAKLQGTISNMKKDIWDAAPLCLPPIITSAEMSPPFGINQVRQSIAEACGL
ncbi:putative GTP-binding protein EngB [Psilocybe cubensis]|uniref:GTP-binding protein EngB n=2 Tax=Psilocybe cubensis TaxID=181762 RepID=A0ACB8GVW5_PSICU|nr:putative GTP-binding protein EngB [Psilocybe cubensis]KAH9479766.1 putative GTP-binding protein EngB [Psilocybe cubensis]